MNVILLQDLLVTQYGLRHSHDVLQQMVRHVAKGGFWTADRLEECETTLSLPGQFRPIEISLMEDGTRYLHDGHHRCVSTWLGGRTYLRADEYVLNERTYRWYVKSNPESGYYLAFDPRIHVRSADFLSFQREAQARFQTNPLAGENWRRANEAGYLRRRVLKTVPDLARAICLHVLHLRGGYLDRRSALAQTGNARRHP
jgi:hypothetical protein